jgi:hypothetical protein
MAASYQHLVAYFLNSLPLVVVALHRPSCGPCLGHRGVPGQILEGAQQGTSGLVLKDSTLRGKPVLKRSTCEVSWSSDTCRPVVLAKQLAGGMNYLHHLTLRGQPPCTAT